MEMPKFTVEMPQNMKLEQWESFKFMLGHGMDHVTLKGDGTLSYVVNGGGGIRFEINLIEMKEALMEKYRAIQPGPNNQ